MSKVFLYTDGGYSRKLLAGSSAYALIDSNNNLIESNSFLLDDPDWLISWNIGPELFAVTKGLESALNKDYDEIQLIYDYVGVKNWATGKWKKCDKEYKKIYIDFIKEIHNRGIILTYKHVKGHTGCKYNEMVDYLCTKELKDYKCHLKEIGIKINPKIHTKS